MNKKYFVQSLIAKHGVDKCKELLLEDLSRLSIKLAASKEVEFKTLDDMHNKSIKELMQIKNKLNTEVVVKRKYNDYKYCLMITIQELQMRHALFIDELKSNIIAIHELLEEINNE